MHETLALDASALPALALTGSGSPRSVSVVHYGPDGVAVATTGQASYAAGAGGGTQVSYVSKRAGGAPWGSSQLSLGPDGRPRQATSLLHNADGSTRRQVAADYRALVFDATGGVVGGAAAFTVSDAGGQPLHRAQMQYANERLDNYTLHAVPAAGAAAGAATLVSYAGALWVGNRLAGGELALTHCRDGSTPSTQSRSLLDAQGRPSQLHATNLAADGKTALRYVQSDYRGITFSALGRIHEGDLVISSQAADGSGGSSTVFSFSAGKLLRTAQLAPGQVIAPAAPAAAPTPPGAWVPNRPADRTSTSKRTDGSLLEQRQDWFRQPTGSVPVPYRSQVTRYATDGRTAVRLTDIDYRAAQCDATGRPVGGTVVSTRFEGGVRASTTNVTY